MTPRSPPKPKSKRPYHDHHHQTNPSTCVNSDTVPELFDNYARFDSGYGKHMAIGTGCCQSGTFGNKKKGVWDARATRDMEQHIMRIHEDKIAEEEVLEQRQGGIDLLASPSRRTCSSIANHAVSHHYPAECGPHFGMSALNLFDRTQGSANENVPSMALVSGGDECMDAHFQKISNPVQAGLNEVRRIARYFGIGPQLLGATAIPAATITASSVQTFLQCTGSLIYLWSHDQAIQALRSLDDSVSDLTPTNAVEAFAMAAIGSYCDGDLGEKLSSITFLEYFICMLSSPLSIRELSYMRLFACLAICRFTDSTDSARILLCKSFTSSHGNDREISK